MESNIRSDAVKDSRKIFFWFGLALLLIVLMVTISMQSVKQSEHADASRKRTYEILDAADDFMSSMKDIETGARGYLILGEAAYLSPYLQGKGKMALNLADLLMLTKNKGVQQQRINKVIMLADEKLAVMGEIVSLRQKHDLSGPI
ncbi:MAG: CHASE3 domain-containing protein [Gallionella sp.]